VGTPTRRAKWRLSDEGGCDVVEAEGAEAQEHRDGLDRGEE